MKTALEIEEDAKWEAWEQTQDYASRMHLPVSWMPLPARVKFDPALTEDELARFSETNDVVWVEREADGTIYMRVIHPTRIACGSTEIAFELGRWAEKDGRGHCYGSAGWRLPDGAMRGASVSWALDARTGLNKDEKDGFLRMAPDFVAEFASVHEDREYLLAKMDQWMANGVQLAWLVDVDERRVAVYRAGQESEVIEAPEVMRGDGVLAGFEVEMAEVWDPWKRARESKVTA